MSSTNDQNAVANDAEPPTVEVTMAQTYCRGPLKAPPQGTGKPVTKEELDACVKELQQMKAEHGLTEPVRSFMDDPGTERRFGGPPDYTLANLAYFQGRTKAHPEGSLELIVENLVKTWEMERSHKVQAKEHKSIDPEKFHIGANGWKKYNNEEAQSVGNYNVLLSGCPTKLWDAENTTWAQSHAAFHDAFASFPWEVLEVFSGPPKVAFSWRHWAHFTGSYEGNKGKGELVELYGFGVAEVNDKLQLVDVEIYYYKPDEFLQVMKGERPADDLSHAKTVMGTGCPIRRFQVWACKCRVQSYRALLRQGLLCLVNAYTAQVAAADVLSFVPTSTFLTSMNRYSRKSKSCILCAVVQSILRLFLLGNIDADKLLLV